MLDFYLRNVFDIELKKEALVEARGVPRKSGFPAVEVAVQGEALRREVDIGQNLHVDRIVYPQHLKGIDAQIRFDPRGFARCCAESPHGNVVREVESPRPGAGKIAVQIAFKAEIRVRVSAGS